MLETHTVQQSVYYERGPRRKLVIRFIAVLLSWLNLFGPYGIDLHTSCFTKICRTHLSVCFNICSLIQSDYMHHQNHSVRNVPGTRGKRPASQLAKCRKKQIERI